MTTIVNTPAPESNNPNGVIIGIIDLVVFGFIFIYFGIPIISRQSTPQTNTPNSVINIPDKVDINVKQTN
jgi:hypothetical protein